MNILADNPADEANGWHSVGVWASCPVGPSLAGASLNSGEVSRE